MFHDDGYYLDGDYRESGRWRMATAPITNVALDHLQACLRDATLWRCYLESLSERPDLSVLNLAVMAVKRHERGYDSCRDIRTKEGWECVGAYMRRGLTADDAIVLNVPTIDEEGHSHDEEVEYWPRSCVQGAPRSEAHAPSVTYDLRKPSDIGVLAQALAEVEMDKLPAISAWALYHHFAFPVNGVPEMPNPDDVNAARRFLKHVGDETKRAVDLTERSLAMRSRGRMMPEYDAYERSQRDAMRFRAPRDGRRDRDRSRGMYEAIGEGDPRMPEGAMREPASPRSRLAKGQTEEKPEDNLTILEERPTGPPPVLPLEKAVEEVRAKLYPRGKKG